MKQYIDKDAIVAEISRRFNEYSSSILKHYDACKESKAQELGKILTILDTLEVKEVDDEKCKEYDKALSIAKAWYKSSDSSAQERNVARMIMGDKVREEL